MKNYKNKVKSNKWINNRKVEEKIMIKKDRLEDYVDLYWKDMTGNSLSLYQIKEIFYRISLRVNKKLTENREKKINGVLEKNRITDINDSENYHKA